MSVEIYERLPFEKYKQLPGVHFSGLKNALKSGLQYQHAETNEREDTAAFRFGRAVHTACSEPHRFLAEYAQFETTREDGSKRIRRGKEWEEFLAANPGKTILAPDEFETVCKIRDIVRDHPVAGPLVRGPGKNELSLRWKDKRTGIDCKGRLDRITTIAIPDFKTTTDVTPAVFEAHSAKLHYFMQAAFYQDGAEACGLGRLQPKIIAIEKDAPHDVIVFNLGDDVLDYGRDEYERAIDKVIECRKSQKWPGQATEHEIEMFLPAWAMKQSELETEPVDFGTEVIA